METKCSKQMDDAVIFWSRLPLYIEDYLYSGSSLAVIGRKSYEMEVVWSILWQFSFTSLFCLEYQFNMV